MVSTAATSADLAAAVVGQTVPERFAATVAARPDAAALRWRDGEAWSELTWRGYAEAACRVAGGLRALGVGPGTRVVLMMRNRPEFHVADVAALLLGATPISIYNSSSPEQVAYLARHCGACVAVVEDRGFVDRVLEARASLPALREVVVIDPTAVRDGVRAWDDVAGHAPVDLEAAARTATPSDLATVIYTSGTTGPPKGVMLDHANVCWTVESLRRCFGDVELAGRRLISYLPMAHVAERMTSHYQAIALGYEVTTCPEPSLLSTYLPQVRPEIMFAVPRVWEKLHAGVRGLLSGDDERRVAFEAALGVGAEVAALRARSEEPAGELAARHEHAEVSVLAPARALLGLDALLSAISGAAPIAAGDLEFFRALGVPFSEIYGLSECSGPMTWAPFLVRPGTVGPAMPGCEVRLEDDGEVSCRGGNVFRGYLDDPEKTAEVLGGDGWLHSGDIGVLDGAGYLRIVDRKKELIVTAGGKNVSPANIEAALKAHPLVGQACVVGDDRPFIAALVVLDPDTAPAWAARRGLAARSAAELAADEAVRAEVWRGVEDANAHFSRAEQVRRITILADEWLPDSDELTPTMKLKRRGVHRKYAAEIAALYR